jgi:hypothetical protein
MKHLLTGVAVVAALAFAAPVWAQNPSGGNAQGLPGPNPGGPGLTPYSSGPQPRAMPAAPPAAMAPSGGMPMSESTSAMPPSHRHARHVSHEKMAHHRGKTELSGSTANQLNQEELARLQAGNTGMPPAPPPPGPGAAQPMQPMGTTGGGAPYRP